MHPDPYETFAERYDGFYESFSEHEPRKVEFFRELLVQHQVRSVLDCACGTGRDLHLLHSLGFEVVGSDRSMAMLAQAERNLATHHLNLSLDQVDFRELHLYYAREFDAVICLSSAILELPEPADMVQAFSSMREVLREDGVLVVSSAVCDRMWREKPRFIPEVWRYGYLRMFVIDYLGEGARFNVIDVQQNDNRIGTQVWSITYNRVYLRDDIERALMAARFRKCTFYGDYLFEPYDRATSGLLLAVAEK